MINAGIGYETKVVIFTIEKVYFNEVYLIQEWNQVFATPVFWFKNRTVQQSKVASHIEVTTTFSLK